MTNTERTKLLRVVEDEGLLGFATRIPHPWDGLEDECTSITLQALCQQLEVAAAELSDYLGWEPK